MKKSELEAAFAQVVRIINAREDGADFVPIAQKLEAALAATRSREEDLQRYRRMA